MNGGHIFWNRGWKKKFWKPVGKGKRKKKGSREWFRSIDLWVMGPARSHCATLLHGGKAELICIFETIMNGFVC